MIRKIIFLPSCLQLFIAVLHFYGRNGSAGDCMPGTTFMTDERNLDDIQISADALPDTIYLHSRTAEKGDALQETFQSALRCLLSVAVATL